MFCALLAVVWFLDSFLARFGYVKLSKHNLRLESGRVVFAHPTPGRKKEVHAPPGSYPLAFGPDGDLLDGGDYDEELDFELDIDVDLSQLET